MPRRAKIPFFTDHNVPESVAVVLEGAGHHVTRLREVMPTDSPDPVVAAACEKAGLVLVSHDKDFKEMVRRVPLTRTRFNQLSWLRLGCLEPRSAERVAAALSLIEHEWRISQSLPDKRVIIFIGDNVIRSHR